LYSQYLNIFDRTTIEPLQKRAFQDEIKNHKAQWVHRVPLTDCENLLNRPTGHLTTYQNRRGNPLS